MPAAKTARNKHLNKPLQNAQYNAGHIDVTKDELDRISEAMKKEEFRKLLLEYCDEIQDPENRKRYEQEIIQLEAERGVQVKFVNPEPGFVIKTSVNGTTKCFINVAKSKQVGPPSNQMHLDTNTGQRGLNWSLPMAQGAPREDLDAAGKRCTVYDVVFHPDTLRLAENNKNFRKCVVDTALDAVERAYEVKLYRTNLKFPKLDFKGVARPTVIRTLAENVPSEEDIEPNPLEDIYPAKPKAEDCEPKKLPMKMNLTQPSEFTTPSHCIKYRRGVDYAECTYELDAKLNAARPHELVVCIDLPMLKTTAECQLDVTDRSIYLLSERVGAKYRLSLDLPYEVDDKAGCARFIIETRQLEITLPVKKVSSDKERDMLNILMHREDSGVESDERNEMSNNSRDSPVQTMEPNNSSLSPRDSPVEPIEPSVENDDFLRANVDYKMPPKFDCNALENMMSLVLHVFNVQPASIKLCQPSDQSVHLQFVSMGSGFCAAYYAFYMELPTDSELTIETAHAEAWENNVVLNLTLNTSSDNFTCENFFAGLNKNELKEYAVQGMLQMPAKAEPTAKSPCYMDVMVEREDERVEVAIRPRASTPPRKQQQHQRKKNKTRSFSESTCDDFNKVYQKQTNNNKDNDVDVDALQEKMVNLNCSHDGDDDEDDEKIVERTKARAIPNKATQNNSKQQRNNNKQRSYSECSSNTNENTLPSSFKGILKRHSNYDKRPSMTDSCCSSYGDDSWYGCSADYDAGFGGYSLPKSFNEGIKEEEENTSEKTSEHLSESCKKTVRFSENIKKLIFRMDSSILGRRKKNQKCKIRKQRAIQRRLSEGDSADYEVNDNDVQPQNNNNNTANNKTNNEKEFYFKKPQNYENYRKKQQQNTSKNARKEEKGGKKARARLESESSSDVDNNKNSMIFEMDM